MDNYEIIYTDKAIEKGFTPVSKKYFKKYNKFSVVYSKSKIILMTSETRWEAECYIRFLNGSSEIPEIFKKRMRSKWE
jgi:hypothetical protein